MNELLLGTCPCAAAVAGAVLGQRLAEVTWLVNTAAVGVTPGAVRAEIRLPELLENFWD